MVQSRIQPQAMGLFMRLHASLLVVLNPDTVLCFVIPIQCAV